MLMATEAQLNDGGTEMDLFPTIARGKQVANQDGRSFVDCAAIAAMQTLIVVYKGVLDPDTCASLAFDFAEALNNVRDSKHATR
jgi:hypothetical protein